MVTDDMRLHLHDQQVLDILSDYRFARVVDVGCGTGMLTERIGDAVGCSELFGVDVSEAALQVAEERGVTTYRRDVNEDRLPFEDGSVDLVYLGEVIDYVDEVDHLFGEIRRVLRDQGVFLLSLTNLCSVHNRIAVLLGRLPFQMRPENDSSPAQRLEGSDEQKVMVSSRRTHFNYPAITETLSNYGFRAELVVPSYSTRSLDSGVVRFFERLTTLNPSWAFRVIILGTQ